MDNSSLIFVLATFVGSLGASCYGAADGTSPPPIETVKIAGATLNMGTPLKKGDREYHDDERLLTVTVPSFRIGKFPVTAEQMCAFLNSEMGRKHGRESLFGKQFSEWWPSSIFLDAEGKNVPRKNAESAPANLVTWKGAVLFCEWYSHQAGKKYRLPSEAEWELAARGAEGRNWPWGDAEPTVNHGERYIRSSRTVLPLSKVGSHPANATKDGVFDLLAYTNDEWCANEFFAHPTAEQANDSRADPNDLKSKKVARGYRARDYRRGPKILQATEYGFGRHYGRPWTRVGFDADALPEELHGFRVVEQVSKD